MLLVGCVHFSVGLLYILCEILLVHNLRTDVTTHSDVEMGHFLCPWCFDLVLCRSFHMFDYSGLFLSDSGILRGKFYRFLE